MSAIKIGETTYITQEQLTEGEDTLGRYTEHLDDALRAARRLAGYIPGITGKRGYQLGMSDATNLGDARTAFEESLTAARDLEGELFTFLELVYRAAEAEGKTLAHLKALKEHNGIEVI